MRVAFLCKHRYMGKDVINDRYARLYEIPHQLARLGHTVLGLCLGYQGQQEGVWQHQVESRLGSLTWEARSVSKLRALELTRYPARTLTRLRGFGPDVLIGASDIPHVALAGWLAKRLQVPYVADLYDNFEGFGQARIVGMASSLRRAVRNADLVTTTSEPLSELVRDVYGANGKVVSMPSTVDKNVFRPMDRATCRDRLGLPRQARLVGTAGALHKVRGVGTLYEAWRLLARADRDVHLVLAGSLDRALALPKDPRVHYLGELPHPRTAELFCALDVGVIYLRDTAFGGYCFPQKAYEMLACGLPVVAADLGAMGRLLAESPQCLYRVDDPRDLATRMRAQLKHPVNPEIRIDGWASIVSDLEQCVRCLVPQAS